MSAAELSTAELEAELARRNCRAERICPTCNNWSAYMGCSRSWREELHCDGCRKPVALCWCRH